MNLCIEGSAENPDHLEFFTNHFRIEAAIKGYIVTESRANAENTFRFEVLPHIILYDDGIEEVASTNDDQYILRIGIIRNSDGEQLVSFDFPFTDLDAMNEHTQSLFAKAIVSIPLPAEIIIDTWRNKWLYVRASLEFPVTFYILKPIGLEHGAVYGGSGTSYRTVPIDNKVMALPAATLGVEVQFLNFMSVEPKFQVGMENLGDSLYFNFAVGLEIKVPRKFIRHVMLEPYVAASYPLLISPNFVKFPMFGVGAGVQLGIQVGRSGVLFLDVNYMYFIGDAVIKNFTGGYTPNPTEIHYQRSVIGIGIGYKFGFIDRR
jgi:hypothetical protein